MNQNEYAEKVYKYKNGHEQIKAEASYGYTLESLEINNGMYMHVRDMEYPEKGFASTTDIFSINAVKKMIMESLKLGVYIFPLLLVPNKTLQAFNTIAFRIMSPCILQKQHLTPMAQELYKFLLSFLNGIGIKNDIAEQFTEIIINIINFDNAYRYRIQDLFNETTVKQLMNPRKEFKRLLEILAKRDNLGVTKKFKLFYSIISLIMYLPKAQKAYQNALNDMDITKIQPDEADRFWMCIRNGYYYFGKNDKERMMMINHLKFVIPTKLVV